MKKTEQNQTEAKPTTRIENIWNVGTSEFVTFQLNVTNWNNYKKTDVVRARKILAETGNVLETMHIDGKKAGLKKDQIAEIIDDYYVNMPKSYKSCLRKYSKHETEINQLLTGLEAVTTNPERMIKLFNAEVKRLEAEKLAEATEILDKYHDSDEYENELAEVNASLLANGKNTVENQDIKEKEAEKIDPMKKGFKVNTKTTVEEFVKVNEFNHLRVIEMAKNNEFSSDQIAELKDYFYDAILALDEAETVKIAVTA